MNERIVRYKAVADFLDLARDTRRAREEMERLKRAENELNASSARGSTRADAADAQRQKTRKGLIASMSDYVKASDRAAASDTTAARALRERSDEQTRYSRSLQSVARSVKDYAGNVQRMIDLESRAGGAKRELARAQQEQARASKTAEEAAERLRRAEERLAATQERVAREAQDAAAARVKAANSAERAAASLAAAEERLNNVPTDRPDLARKAELSLIDARAVSERAAARLEQAEKRLSVARNSRDSSRVRKAERDVSAAMNASVAAAGRLESVSKRVDGVMGVLQSSGAGLGGMLGTLQRGFGNFAASMASSLPTLIALGAAIPVIISFLGVLAGGLAAVAGGAVALASALSPVIGVLGALPGAIGGAIFAIGTLAAAFFGVGEAVKESLNVQKESAKVAKDAAKAQRQAARQVMDARRALRNATEAQARGEITANRQVRDAIRALADARTAAVEGQEQADRSLMIAERGLRDAQESARRAQLNLNEARRDAIRNILDMKEAVEDTARSEKRASLSLEEARLNLQQTLSDPNATDLEKRSAALAVEEAQDALDDIKKSAEEARKEYDKARKEGVEKSEAVVEARRQEREALENLADAQYSVSQAVKAQTRQQVEAARAIQRAQEALTEAVESRSRQQRDAAESVATAQQNLNDAYESQKEAALTAFTATEKLRQAMAELSPEGQAFVKLLLRLKPILDEIRFAAQRGLFPGLGLALQTFAELAPIITPAVEKMAKAIANAAVEVANVTKSPIFRGQLARILDSSAKIMENVGTIVANLVSVFMNIADAARPFTEWLAETTVGWTEQWKAMTSGKKGQQRLTDFFAEARETLELVGTLLWNFGKALLGIGKASKDVGKGFLRDLADAATRFAAFVNSKEGQARIKKWFEDIAPVVKDIAGGAKDLLDGILGLADDPGVAKFFADLRDEFIPALVNLVEVIGAEPAGGFLDLLTVFMNWGADTTSEFGKFVGHLAYFLALITPLDEESSGAKVSMNDFLGSLTQPTGLQLLNFALDKLRDLINWFKGEGEAEAGGGSWGERGPLQKLGDKLDWLQGRAAVFLAWLGRNWPRILGILISPFGKAYLWLQENWIKFQIWISGKIGQFLTWLQRNWGKVTGFFTSPVSSALTKLTELWPKIERGFSDMWDRIIRGAQSFNRSMVTVMEELKKFFRDPIGYVINTVLNGALINGFNSLVSKITGNDSLNIPHIPVPKFATGGVYPGYTPGRDIGYIGVSGGEAIMRPEWTRAIGKGEVDRMNAAARRGGKKGVLRYLGGFASGGNVEGSSGGGEFAPTSFRGKRMNYRTIKMLLAAEKLSGKQFRITQGSYSTSVAASGSTHAGGGVLDLGWTGSNTDTRNLRRVGFAAWHRNPLQGPWNDHFHIVAIGDPTASASAKRQVASYLAGGNGLGGTDDGPRVAIDPALASKLGITDAVVAAAAKGGGGSFLDTLAGWVKSAIGNPVGFLRDKIAEPIKNMFSSFGSGNFTKALAKLPEAAIGAMASSIKSQIGNWLSNLLPGDGGGYTASSLRSMVQKRAAAFGWDKGGNWDALQWIIQKESSWNPNAKNPNSSAYGLFQFLDGTWSAMGVSKSSDPGVQTDAGLRYIRQRYGTPEAARAFHQNNGWYADGGVVGNVQAFARGGMVGGVGNRDTVPAMLTPGEFVLRKEVAKKIGVRKLQALNAKKAGKLRPTDDGIQHFHAGGPVMGIRRGMTGNTVRALRYLWNMPTGASPVYGRWDTNFDRVARQPDAWSKLSNTWKLRNRDPRYIKLANFMRNRAPKTYAQGRDFIRVNDATMMKVWEGMRATVMRTMPAARWKKLDQGYIAKRKELYGYAAQLQKALGLGHQGSSWNGYTRGAMKHVLDHVYGRSHYALAYRPWGGGHTPVEIAASNAITANRKQNEFNGFLEILSSWGLTDLVKDLLEKGVDEGYTIAQSAVKNKTVATLLNNEIKKSKLLTAEDQGNILTMISTLASSVATVGLREMARALGLSDLSTVQLYEKAVQLGRLSKVPKSKLTKLNADIASFRAGTFYAAGGGEVPGTGSGDTVPAMLTPGEFVLRKAAVKALGLDAAYWLNSNPQKFAEGGLVRSFQLAGLPQVTIPRIGAGLRSGAAGSSTTGGVTVHWDVDIHNPVAESSTKSLTKVLQRSAVISGASAGKAE